MTQAPSAKPDHQRPELPDFWDKRFAAGATPTGFKSIRQRRNRGTTDLHTGIAPRC